ncbi:MAG: hypothetical protein Q9162_000161 [Coniocarpon cinnabarinum]
MLRARRKVRFDRRRSDRRTTQSSPKYDAPLKVDAKRPNTMTAQFPLSSLSLDDMVEDEFATRSSELDAETAEKCMPLLVTRAASPVELHRESHIKYINHILRGLPAGFSSLDASRPWLLYWSMTALALLGENLAAYREPSVHARHPVRRSLTNSEGRLKASLRAIQDPAGGFGGGHTQIPHLATSYAAVLALTNVGGDALDIIDRQAM